MIADPEIIRQILIKDFDAFTDHSTFDHFPNKYEKHFLVWLKGDYWKKIRTFMSPTFTSGKIKRMFKLIDSCADDLIELFHEKIGKAKINGSILNVQHVFNYFTMDGITTCCYGIKLERASKLKNGYKTGTTREDFVKMVSVLGLSRIRIIAIQILPKTFLRMIGFELNPRDRAEPLVERIERMIDIRRKSSKKSPDFLQSIIDAKFGDKIELGEMDLEENHHASLTPESLLNDQQQMIQDLQVGSESSKVTADGKSGLSDIEIIAQAILMLGAGYETTSVLMTSCSYSLAFHPDVQERLYEELKKISEFNADDGKYHFDYEKLTSCLYLDAVISETLRLLPPAIGTDRVALRDYYIEKYNVLIPKGIGVMLAIHSVQNDPEFWEDPSKFNPDRFMPGNKEKIIPGTYLPFSMGPRHCIGMRFSLTEAKLGLAKLVVNFKLEQTPGTKFPPDFTRTPHIPKIANPIVRVIPRE